MSTADEKPVNAAPVPASSDTEEKSPEQIRAEIDATREELGDTVEALAAKTDVKAQAKAKVEDTKAQARAKVEDVKSMAQAAAEEAKAKAKDAAPESPQEGVQQAQALVKQNPKPAAIAGGVLVLFVLWRLLRR
jgi:ABC-type transporter Mla subunit MlaD